MGPMATCDLFNKVIRLTSAEKDQEHVHLIIDNNTDIPDRSAHILGHGIDPLPEMKKAVAKLIFDGADVLAMPCNTAHYYYDQLSEFAGTLNEEVRFLHMIDETANYCKEHDYKKVLLFATQGTYTSNIYKTAFESKDVEVCYPQQNEQKQLMEAIYDYKKGLLVDTENFKQILQSAEENGVSAVVLGCTELPLIFSGREAGLSFIDPTAILAESLSQLK